MTDGFDLGGGGGNAFSFGPQGSQPGAFVSGTVLDMKEVQETNYDTKEPEFWPNGDPKMQYRLTLQTELRDPDNPNDDGKRDVYLNGYRKPHPKTGTSSTLYATLEAVRAATGGTQLKPGGKLTLQWISGMGFTGDPRHYQAWYEAPALSLDNPAATAPPATPPQQAAPPAAPPQTVQQTIATQGPPPTFAQPPNQGAAVAPPTTPPPAGPPPGTAPVAPPTQAAPPAAPPAAGGAPQHSPETIAALQAAGIDPANVPVQA